MLIVPVQATPNQTFSILLGNQSCQITLTTRFYGLYSSIWPSTTRMFATASFART